MEGEKPIKGSSGVLKMNKYEKAWNNVRSLAKTSNYYNHDRDSSDIELIEKIVMDAITKLNQHHIHQNRGYQPHTNKSTKPQKPPIGTRGDDA